MYGCKGRVLMNLINVLEIYRFGDLNFWEKVFMDLKLRGFKDLGFKGLRVKEVWDF